MRQGHRLLSLALAALVPACSWALVDPPPLYVGPEATEVDCTDGLASPIADTVIAAGMYTAATALLLASRRDDNETTPTGGVSFGILLAIPAFLIAVPHTFSAAYGYTKTARCRRLQHIVTVRRASPAAR